MRLALVMQRLFAEVVMFRQVEWGSQAALWVLLAMALMFAFVTAVCVMQPHQPKEKVGDRLAATAVHDGAGLP
jgi:hypothetical protein